MSSWSAPLGQASWPVHREESEAARPVHRERSQAATPVNKSKGQAGRPVLLLTLLLTGCGYRVSGQGDLVPETVKTIAIPAFSNATTRYKLSDRLPESLSREFLTRTRYRVVSNEGAADAVLRGAVLQYSSLPTIFDPETNRASGVELRVMLQISFTERESGKVLYSRPAFEVRERFQISTNPALYYEESEDALNRASQQVARQVVSAILQGAF